MPYELIVDGAQRPLGESRYLLSPGDLYTIEQIPEIVDIGISALKIEGRYKDAEYVALTTRAYRKAVDDAWKGAQPKISELERLQLEQVYSRGLGPYFVTGTNHQTVVQGRSPRHRGVDFGSVVRVLANSVEIKPSHAHSISPLKPGDGVVFDAASWRSPQELEEGGRVFEVAVNPNGNLELHFGNGAITFARIRIGDLVWRTSDPEIDRVARPYLNAASPLYKLPVRVNVTACVGQKLRMVWSLARKPELEAIVESESPIREAQNRAADADYFRDQLSRLGNTPYELDEVVLQAEGKPFVPASLINQMRRDAVAMLQALQRSPTALELHHISIPIFEPVPDEDRDPHVHFLVRTPEQLDAALQLRPASITLDYLDLYGLKPSVEKVRTSGVRVRVAAPRILKPGEERIVEFLMRLDADILVRSSGLLETLGAADQRELIGDFSLNAANSVSADLLLRLGLKRITPTHDLNAEQVALLAQQLGGEAIEAIAYQHLPVFHTEHCVFCRFLSSGTSFKDCGRPCEKHVVSLRDVNGRAHPLLADIGCRNTVFGAEAQDASAHLDLWRNAGIRHFRLEFAHETGDQVLQIGKSFLKALAGTITYDQLSFEWKRSAPQGVTEGSLFVPLTVLQ